MKAIKLVLGILFILFGAYLFLETGFRQGFSIGHIISLFFLIFGIILTFFKHSEQLQKINEEKNVKKLDNKLTKVALILLIIAVVATIITFWVPIHWLEQGDGFNRIIPLVIIVIPAFVISFILYIISLFRKNK